MSHLPVIISGKDPKNGFDNRTDSTLSMSGSDFQITTASSYTFWSGGNKFVKTTTQTAAISTDQALHYVYFDTAGALQVSTTAWDIVSDNVPVALVYKDSTTYTINDERHGATRDRGWHKWAHTTIGARWVSGFSSTFNNTTLSVAQGVVADEDIQYDTGGTKTACNLWYRNSGLTSMRLVSNVSTPYKVNAGTIQFDSGGTLTNVTNNKYINSWVYATDNIDYPVQIVVGQAEYLTDVAARSDPAPAILLSTAEWKLIYRVMYKNVGGTPTYIESTDYRQVSSGPATSFTPTDHATLTNRDAANSHPASAIGSFPVQIGVACSDEGTDLTTGTKVYFRTPCAMTVTAVRASLTTAATGTDLLTVDINEGGTSILSTKLTIDASETTSTTAATPAVISDTALADDAEMTIDIDKIGNTTAGKGLKVWIIGTRA